MTIYQKLSQISNGQLQLKLAQTPAEIEAAQRCRFDVFYTELGAHPINNMAARKQDYDDFDPICDHLLVLDTTKTGMAQVVGTYRLLRHRVATQAGIGLYTETEFDLTHLKTHAASQNADILEFSRSCVLPDYRGRLVINLLWKGLAVYIQHYNARYLVGTPSFHGTNMAATMPELSYLATHFPSPATIQPTALPHLQQLVAPLTETSPYALKTLMMSLPPLIKGYLRLGATFSPDAVIDQQFNTIDMCMILDFAQVSEKHLQYYTRQEDA